MHRYLVLSLATCLSFCSALFSQEKFALEKDLRSEWMIYDQEKEAFTKNAEPDAETIYFDVNPSEQGGGKLTVIGHDPFFIFIGGKIVRTSDRPVSMSLDSLGKIFGYRPLRFAIHQPDEDVTLIKTLLVVPSVAAVSASEEKPPSYFRDFVFLAGLMLIIFFVVILRVQPKLAAEYFSPSKILTFREADDAQGHARFALSSNVWYYAFCSMLLALVLMVIYNFLPENFVFANELRATGFPSVFLKWLWLTLVILLILSGRILIIYVLSNLFGMRGIAAFHFFNVIRLLLIAGGALSLIVFLYFVWRVEDPEIYQIILSVLVVLSSGWILLIFLKLNSRTEHTMFHLFSYICATEVIPLLIILKVLFH